MVVLSRLSAGVEEFDRGGAGGGAALRADDALELGEDIAACERAVAVRSRARAARMQVDGLVNNAGFNDSGGPGGGAIRRGLCGAWSRICCTVMRWRTTLLPLLKRESGGDCEYQLPRWR